MDDNQFYESKEIIKIAEYDSSEDSLHQVEKITGKPVPFYNADISDRAALEDIFASNEFDCVIHFAGLKSVGESVLKSWEYYDNNVNGTMVLLDVMRNHGCKKLIFSSSATVYGEPEVLPITEDHPKGICTNPYGQTKSMIEEILKDMYTADVKVGDSDPWSIVLLRYFNPVGAHSSGLIGENPNGIPNNLMPYICQVASGRLECLHVFGDDYDTPDGTGVSDFIHVVDLARGHVAALSAVSAGCGVKTYNLGTGRGYSVLELVRAFERVNGVTVPYVVDGRRAGDLGSVWSDPSKAWRELGWKPEKGIDEMCRDAWGREKNCSK